MELSLLLKLEPLGPAKSSLMFLALLYDGIIDPFGKVYARVGES